MLELCDKNCKVATVKYFNEKLSWNSFPEDISKETEVIFKKPNEIYRTLKAK